MDGNSPLNISKTFDRVIVVNLARRPERLQRFNSLLTDWPFRMPERFEAVDGEAVGVPAEWDKGPGAWGCMLSHRQVLDQAIRDGVRSLLVLEDDAYPVDHFAARAGEFLQQLPNDWDGLHFGAQHLLPPKPVLPGVVRCVASNRTHAFAVRGRLMPILLQFWQNTVNDHCDIVLSALMTHFKFYAPDPLLIGQDCGYSDINGRHESLRFLSPAEQRAIINRDPRFRAQRMVMQVGQRASTPAASIAGVVVP
jgi:hypothetical protein